MADRGQVSISDFQAEGEVFSLKTVLKQEANDMSRAKVLCKWFWSSLQLRFESSQPEQQHLGLVPNKCEVKSRKDGDGTAGRTFSVKVEAPNHSF